MLGKTLKKLNAFFLVVCIIVLQFSISASALTFPAFAVIGNDNKGYTTASVYTKPGTTGHEVEGEKGTSQFIETLNKGEKVKLLSSAKDGDKDLWYKIGYGANYAKEGYVYELRVTIIGSYTEDTDFEAWLAQQNFPESYKSKLRDLHSLYPNWVFYADHIDLDWAEVIAAETRVGIKTIHKSSPDSWKSMEPGAYNYDTGTWQEWTGGYVTASKMVVEYYTDPRNFLNSQSIFMFSSHSYDEKYDTKENLMLMIGSTFLNADLPSPPDNAGMTYADAIMNAAKTANVSPFVIASTILQEQGSATSGNISGNYPEYEGYYNFFNIGATDALGTAGGLKYASTAGSYGRPWNTREKSITGGAMWYADGYVSVGQDTYYYMNFDVIANGSGLYNHQYASHIRDTEGKAEKLAKAYGTLMDSSLVFHIPVYRNMPEITRLPEENGNNDNFLSSLTVKNHTLYGFNKYQTEYELIVENSVESIEITAVASSTFATIEGVGVKALSVGDNEFDIIVTASSGEKRTYNLYVNRLPSTSNPNTPNPTLNGSYSVGDYLTGVEPDTAVADFITKLGVQNGTARVFDKSNNEKGNGNISNGDIVKLYNNLGVEAIQYRVVIYGDLNGDSQITISDLAMIKAYLLDKISLSDYVKISADVTKSGDVSISDLAKIKATLLNKTIINQ